MTSLAELIGKPPPGDVQLLQALVTSGPTNGVATIRFGDLAHTTAADDIANVPILGSAVITNGDAVWVLRSGGLLLIVGAVLGGGGAMTLYTPALTGSVTNPTLGTGGIIQGKWSRLAGRQVRVEYYVKFGTSGTAAGNGIYWVSLPFPAAPALRNSAPRGLGWGFNAVGNLTYAGVELVGPPWDRVEHREFSAGLTVFGDTTPFVWGPNMEIHGSLIYEAAS